MLLMRLANHKVEMQQSAANTYMLAHVLDREPVDAEQLVVSNQSGFAVGWWWCCGRGGDENKNVLGVQPNTQTDLATPPGATVCTLGPSTVKPHGCEASVRLSSSSRIRPPLV